MRRLATGIALGVLSTVLLAGTAFAATGGSFILGRNNAAGAQTLLTNSGSGPILALSTRAGQVPLAVSVNAGKASNLNADRLDGLDAVDLQRRVSGSCSPGSAVGSIDATGGAACQTTQDAPVQIFTGGMSNGFGRADCPAGTTAIAGGVVPNRASGKAVLLYSSLYLEASGATGWQAAAEATGGSGYNGTGTIVVTCSSNAEILAPRAALRRAP